MLLSDRLIALLLTRRGDFVNSWSVDKFQHALQCATRAKMDTDDDYWIVAALFHDVFGGFFPESHGYKIADVLAPFIPQDPYCLALKHHEELMKAHWFPEARGPQLFRERHAGVEWFEQAKRFTDEWDRLSFDPSYHCDPLDLFRPVVKRVITE